MSAHYAQHTGKETEAIETQRPRRDRRAQRAKIYGSFQTLALRSICMVAPLCVPSTHESEHIQRWKVKGKEKSQNSD